MDNTFTSLALKPILATGLEIEKILKLASL
jgi:hypothetical protein